jgi:hypothetical protein
MSFNDVYKNMLSKRGGSVVDSDIRNSKGSINRKFKDDPSYKLAKLKKRDVTIEETDLDTRIVNIDTNTLKKKLYLRPDTNVEVGDYIIYPDKTYLVLQVEDNLISPYAECQVCNHLFKWIYKDKIYSAYGIGTNQTKYTLGIETKQAGITEADSRYAIDFPNNEICKTLKVGTRLLFNEGAWKITQIEYISSQDNIRSVLLGQDNINYETDNIDLEMADYRPTKIHSYTFNLPTLLEVSKDKATDLLYSIVDESNKDIDYSVVTLTTDSNLITINRINGVFSITGVNIGTGNIKLSVSLNNKLEERIIPFEVKTTVVSQITYQVNPSNGTLLRLASSTSLVCNKYNDSALIPCNVQYALDTNGQNLLSSKKIDIQYKETKDANGNSLGMNIVWIKNLNCTTANSFSITINDKLDGTVISTQTIQLKGV